MFRNAAPAEAVEIEQGRSRGSDADFVPITHLSLDLPAPATGWLVELERRGIEVMVDDIGRRSVPRDVARMLIAEHAAAAVRKREAMALAEQRAIEADRAFRARLWGGVRAELMPPGASPAAVMLQLDKDSQPRRRSVLQEALSNDSGLTFHSLAPTSDDAS